MRNSLLSVRHSLGLVVMGALSIIGGTAVQADPPTQTNMAGQTTQTTSLTDTSTLNQAITPTQTWDDHAEEILRRLYQRLGGNPGDVANKPVKSMALMVSLRFTIYGLPNGLTADDLAGIESDAQELANCAEWEPGPPDGTSYTLIVLMHDLGKTVYAAALVY